MSTSGARPAGASPALERVFVVVMDSVGCGAMPDAAAFGDAGTDTLGHTAMEAGGLDLPNLTRLGLGNLHEILGVEPQAEPLASFGVMHEASAGKDTTTGHWEIAGLVSPRAFTTYPDGFPPEITQPWLEACGLSGFLGNYPSSGTEILDRLGEEHLRTGLPILYTSADSVFQVAAHEDVIPPARLYEICEAARRVLEPHFVARVIARPFVGERAGEFQRTYNRHDFSLKPTAPTVLDRLIEAGTPVLGVGKISDIFAGQGISESFRTEGNADGMERLLELAREQRGPALVFVNLIDFDMLYGHRRDPAGYAAALEAFDRDLGPVLDALGPADLLLVTADHGCDPTYAATTDHTREQVPLLAYRPGVPGVPLGVRSSFADLGQTVAQAFGLAPLPAGRSFLDALGTAR